MDCFKLNKALTMTGLQDLQDLNENKNVSVLLKWTQIVVFVGIAIFILIP